MPELPEAETIGKALNCAMSGKKIEKVEVFSPKMRTSLLPLNDAGLVGKTILSVRRRGRYLVAVLDDNRGLLMHFGMSGVVRIEPDSIPKRKHEHVFIHLSDGNIFKFECHRRFSLLEVHDLNTPDGFPEVLNSLGVEPLSGNFTKEYFFEKSRSRKIPVKQLLMDNAVVTGIGNIYATEILFASKVDPRKQSAELTLKNCAEIVENSKKILLHAIECGGTTISDFRHVDGSEGKFVLNLKIYGKSGSPCPRCSTVLQSVFLGGRNSCFCPECQK